MDKNFWKQFLSEKLLFGGKYAVAFRRSNFKSIYKMWHWRLVINLTFFVGITGVTFLIIYASNTVLIRKEMGTEARIYPRIFTPRMLENKRQVTEFCTTMSHPPSIALPWASLRTTESKIRSDIGLTTAQCINTSLHSKHNTTPWRVTWTR